MKVILQNDVKDLGKVGDLVKVQAGFARNFLFPRKLAVEASEKNVKEWEHLQRVADVKRKKAHTSRKEVLESMKNETLTFTRNAGDNDKLFGSVTTMDVAEKLNELGYSVDRRDIIMDDQIKHLGQFKVLIKLGEGLEAEVALSVERAADQPLSS